MGEPNNPARHVIQALLGSSGAWSKRPPVRTMSRDQAPHKSNNGQARWLTVLEMFDAQFLILDKQRDSKLLGQVRSRSGWSVDFEDQDSVLYTRVQVPEGTGAAV